MLTLPVGLLRTRLENAVAVVTLMPYLLLRPLLLRSARWCAVPEGAWVFGGHGGRLYEDNAAVLQHAAQSNGERTFWVTSDRALARRLSARGVPVLRRNSLRARLTIEKAEVLVYSHGITDLDHALWWRCMPRGLKIHVNHCLHLLKGERVTDRRSRSGRADPFDYLLASSERERRNLLEVYPGRDAQVTLGGGAHLDLFLAARRRRPTRTIVYFPTFRETAATRRALDRQIAALTSDPRLRAYLSAHDYTLIVAVHVNTLDRRARVDRRTFHPRIRFVDPSRMVECVLESALLISDYSGVLCDYLALGRPAVFFAFDRSDYLRRRRLHVDYDAFAFGPVVTAVPALVDLLVSDRWRDTRPHAERRRRWEREFFPSLEVDYASRSLQTIRRLLRGAAPKPGVAAE